MSGEDVKTTLEMSGEDLKTTLETSVKHAAASACSFVAPSPAKN